MINVFISELTPRVEYTFRLVFKTILNVEIQLHTNESEFQALNAPKINYSNNNTLGGLYLKPFGLLHEKHLQAQYPSIFDWEGEKAFFEVEGSFIPFDIFSAAFFLVSRYEEYLPSKRDHHNRFQARYSCAGKNGFLEKPLVNIWAIKLAEIIKKEYNEFDFRCTKFSYIPTIDIDNAWAFRNKGLVRIVMSLGRDILKGRWKLIKRRYNVLLRIEKDPYDNYDFIDSVLTKFKFKPTYFFLLNNHGKYDRSLSPGNKNFKKLIINTKKKANIGLHPSYESNKSERRLSKEVKIFEKITGNKVDISRQHFLKLSMPDTYRSLIQQGIKADYSMGYSSRPGFRASIATPFNFFDLKENKNTDFKIYPFQVMDVTLLHYRGMRTDNALKKIKSLIDETANVGGTFTSLWHNESLGNNGYWNGWQKVYFEMTEYAASIRDGK